LSEAVYVWLLVKDGDALLLAHHKQDGRRFAGLWTLPGDIMDESESAAETIERVCRDQLGVSYQRDRFVDTLSFGPEASSQAVNIFSVDLAGRPRFRESGPYSEVSWVRPGDIAEPVPALPEDLRQLLLTNN